MAVVAEELISDLIVRDGKLRSGIRSAQQAYGAGIGSMRNDTKRFESEFNRSAGNISSGFKSLAGTLAAGVSVAATGQLIDSFTRLQNSLRVAGLEGKNLEAVQSDLLDLSTRYGVNIEGLANLYGKATDAGKSFGASQAQILQLTEATSQSLLITGTRAEQASGAILGLSQALASGVVRAEEYNQINEGGLRPLLQAAAATARFGGDINKLRAAVLEGTVSSKEFFNAIMAGSAQLEGQASKATLTLSGAFEALNSSLTVYVGTAAQSNGVTAALAGGIKLLADNLETIIPALAIIAAAVGVKYTVALGRATAATVAQSVAATRAAQTQAFLNAVMAESTVITNIYGASAVRTTTAMATMGTAARAAGASLLAAFGGPVSAAIIAFGAVIAGISYAVRDTSASLDELQASAATAQARLDDARKQAAAAGIDIKTMGDQADSASGSFAALNKTLWASVDAMIAASKSAKNLALARIQLENAEARKVIAQTGPRVQGMDAAADRNRRFNAALGQDVTGYEGLGDLNKANLDIDRERYSVAKSTLAVNKENARIIEKLDTYVPPSESRGTGGAAPAADGKKPKKGRQGRSGPTQEEIDDRFASQIEQFTQQILSARQSLATTAEEEAELSRRSLEVSRRAALAELEANEDYSDAQKQRLRQYIERLAEVEEDTIARRETLRLSQEAADLAATEQGLQQEILQNAQSLADTQGERRRIALEMLDSDYRLRRAELDRIIATEGIAKALKDKAIAEREQLDQITQGRRDNIVRDTENPLERLSRESNLTADQMNEAFQSIQADGLTALSDGITDVIMQTRSLGDVFKSVANQIIADLIRIAVQKAVVGALGNALGGLFGGGGLTGTSGGMDLRGFRAGGGPVRAGQLYRVNEGQQEFFRPATDGRVVPLSQAQAARPAASAMQGPTIVQLAVAPGEMFVPIVEGISGNVAVRTVQATAPGIVRAATIETTRRAGRPRT